MRIDVDMSQFDAAMEKINRERPQIIKACISDITMQVMRAVSRITPVDTGDLRLGWFVSDYRVVGNVYEVEISNVEPYAVYVEYGHRIVSKGITIGWKDGVFMLTIAMDAVDRRVERIIARRLSMLFGGG